MVFEMEINLGITKISRQTVRNFIREEGLEPAPKRSQQTWDESLKTHAETLWACDFLSVRSVTRNGIVRLYLLVFLHVDSRRVIVSPATEHPDSAWVTSQAESFLSQVSRSDQQRLQLLRDRDTKFSKDFVNALRPLFGFQMTVRHTTHQIVLVVALTSRR